MQLYGLFTLGFPAAPLLNNLTSLHTITRRTVLQKVPHRALGALCACKHKVSGSFHSPPGVLFTFPSQYCSTIGHQVVFRLGGWSPHIPIGFHVPDGTLDTASQLHISPTGLSPSSVGFPTPFRYTSLIACAVRTPTVLLPSVWPLPLSLATTRGISVDFFSSPYLDVSVREVPHVTLWIHVTFHGSSPWGFPHSEIRGYNAYLQLPAAYRSLSRPSSAPDAKAFTLRSYSLELLNFRSGSLNCLSFLNK